jgi:hypothetical protein
MQSSQRSFEVVLPPPLPVELQMPVAGLVTCSICLSVHRAAGWISAEEAIRELRTYDQREPVQLRPGICDDCSDEIAERREHGRGHALATAA